MGIIAPILGLFVRSQGLSMAQIGLIGTASMLGWFVWEPIMGIIADKFNKRWMLATSLILSTILYAIYPVANGFSFFAILEFAKTSILSAYSIPVKALAAELLPTQERGKVYGRYMTIVSFGGMLSPFLGGYLTEIAGFSLPFYIASGIGLLGLLAVFSIKYNEPVQERKSGSADGIRNILQKPVLVIFSVRGLFFFNAGFAGSFLSIYLNEVPRFLATESQIGAFFTVFRLAGVASRAVVGDISDRIGTRPLISGSLLGMGLSYLGLGFAVGIIPMYFLGAIQGVCQACADTSMMLQLISVMPKERSGFTMGLYSEAENVGGLVSTPSLGYLYQNFGSNSAIWLVTLMLFVNSMYSYFVMPGKSRVK
jgi:MFS family permease